MTTEQAAPVVQQHEKIKGYRTLSQQEIDLINAWKDLGEQAKTLMASTVAHLAVQRNSDRTTAAEMDRIQAAEPARWLALGKTHLQEGLMCAVRAVAQPEGF